MESDLARLDEKALLKLFFDYLHLTILHYGLWFRETENQLGLDKTIAIDSAVWERVLPSFMLRMARCLGVPVKQGNFEALAKLNKEELLDLLEETQKNWLAVDGVWFQAIEKKYDYEMFTAKRINDTCWNRLAYIEGKQALERANLPPDSGLEGLRAVLRYRLYSLIYGFKVIDEKDKVVLQICDCRVQAARKKQGYADYPCKSAGITEHTRFAEAIDPRIRVKCLACPPDPHPADWWCAWEFSLEPAGK